MLVRAIFETIEEINEGGVTILPVEQSARAALRLADKGYVLETGKIFPLAPTTQQKHREVKPFPLNRRLRKSSENAHRRDVYR